MRSSKDSPVDTMGCESAGDKSRPINIYRYQVLVGALLSAQTSDKVTFTALNNLKKFDLTPSNICQTSLNKIEELIYPVGFYRRKAVYLKEVSKIIVEQYHNDIPNNIKELMIGICVDTHVHRISNRLGFVNTKKPEQTEVELEKIIPKERWGPLNTELVGFGQTICQPRKPQCHLCLNKYICPSSNINETDKKSKININKYKGKKNNNKDENNNNNEGNNNNNKDNINIKDEDTLEDIENIAQFGYF